MRIEYHRTLLADRVRNAAFHKALARVIVKGETTVADIGAGTGFLGFLAPLGAKRVGCWTADIAAVARALRRNKHQLRCRPPPPWPGAGGRDRADAGNYPFEENIVRDAQRRARAIPALAGR
jgi:protein arginine N-methyltransferase 1